MEHFQTSTTDSGQGEIHLAGPPFVPGTEVEILVSPKAASDSETDPVTALLAALDRGHNTQPTATFGAKNFLTATSFIDTNVLLYAACNAPADRGKQAIARQVLANPGVGFSAQVMQEFFVAAVTKQRLAMKHHEAVAVLESLAAISVCPVARDLVLEAIVTKQRHGLSYWDAAILTAAKQLGSRNVYSKDLNQSNSAMG